MQMLYELKCLKRSHRTIEVLCARLTCAFFYLDELSCTWDISVNRYTICHLSDEKQACCFFRPHRGLLSTIHTSQQPYSLHGHVRFLMCLRVRISLFFLIRHSVFYSLSSSEFPLFQDLRRRDGSF